MSYAIVHNQLLIFSIELNNTFIFYITYTHTLMGFNLSNKLSAGKLKVSGKKGKGLLIKSTDSEKIKSNFTFLTNEQVESDRSNAYSYII